MAVTLGIRWSCLAWRGRLPWSARPWALPFAAVPVLSAKTCQQQGKRHRSGSEWAAVWAGKRHRWFPGRPIVWVGDGEYATVALVRACQACGVRWVTRMRWDASLGDRPVPQPQSKRGRKPKKGGRQPGLRDRLTDPATAWQEGTVPWYGGRKQPVETTTGAALGYRPGADPVPMRWVLLRPRDDAPGHRNPWALLCSDPDASALEIVAWYGGRWPIEVTFQEMRACLGFETQRHWPRQAMARTTPCRFEVFRVVVLRAQTLHPGSLPVGTQTWYPQTEATFSDALAAVRAHVWEHLHDTNSSEKAEMCLIPRSLWECLQNLACFAA
ncbi:MAG: transposase [Armatimonadetes bacterium]|nr:transposase [Armatimonadota bacterium]